MTCKNCGTILADGIETCTICGTKIDLNNNQENFNQQNINQNNIINKRCASCGAELMDGHNFCTNCGASAETQTPSMNNEENNTFNNQQNSINNIPYQQPNINNVEPKKEILGIVSLVIGIISIIASIPLNILIIPLVIVGLILGIINKSQKGKMISGIITNVIAIVIIICLLILFITYAFGNVKEIIDENNELFNSENSNANINNNAEQEIKNPLVGDYKCTGVSEEKKEENYKIIINLKEDNTFMYGPYKNNDINYAKGTYTYEEENKTNSTKDYEYYMVKLNALKENFLVNGTASTTDFKASVEFGLNQKNEKKQGVIMFVESNNIYYCYEN